MQKNRATGKAIEPLYEKSQNKGNSSSIGIIGGADGPTSITVSSSINPWMIGALIVIAIAVAVLIVLVRKQKK